jgi:hypothetical protein
MPHASFHTSTFPRRGARARIVLFAALALGSACARFGFERLDPDGDGGIGGFAPLDAAAGGRAGDGGVGGSMAIGGEAGAPMGDGGGISGAAGEGAAGDGGAPPDGGTGGPVASCSDGTRNGDELGVDCGGACSRCTCSLGAPERLGDPNHPGNDLWSPRLSGDGLTLFFSVTVPGTGEQIAYASRPDRSSPFGLGNAMPAPINQGNEGTPHPSLDSRRLYFYSERGGGAGSRDLYMATRATGPDPFDGVTVAPLSSLNGPALDHLPWLSPDELTIYFVSGAAGAGDIFRATRSSRRDAFEPPAPMSELNTSSDEGGITVSTDGREAIFTSNRPGGAGARDLYRVRRAGASDPFGAPELLDSIDTADDEIDPAFSPDGRELYFASNRDGGDSALFRAARTCAR